MRSGVTTARAPRRTTSTRRSTPPAASSGQETIDVSDEVVSLADGVDVDVDRFEQAAALARQGAARRPRAVRRSRSTPASCCPRTVTTTGRRTDAATSKSCTNALARELAGLPSGPRSGGLPTDASSFVGRGHELQRASRPARPHAAADADRDGGAGKTRLALELARGEQAPVRGRRRARRAAPH